MSDSSGISEVSNPKPVMPMKVAESILNFSFKSKKLGEGKIIGFTTEPSLVIKIQVIMGSGVQFDARQVYAELKKRNWLPNSDDPLGYIRYTLSCNNKTFLRVEGQRGHYYLTPESPYIGAPPIPPTLYITIKWANGQTSKRAYKLAGSTGELLKFQKFDPNPSFPAKPQVSVSAEGG